MKTNKYLKPVILAGAIVALAMPSAQAADVILEGDYLRVGVNDSGGLIDSAFIVGIDFDDGGTSSWTGFDFLKPGSPYEFFSVGYDGAGWSANGYSYGNNIGGTTTNTSAGSTLSTSTSGTFGDLAITQLLSFDVTDGVIDFEVTLTNTGPSALTHVVYARGLDPDQDVYAGGGYETTNLITGGDLVSGSAPVTDWTIAIFSDSPISHTPSIRADWSADPYTLITANDDGYGDWTINMGWEIGTLDVGSTATITFQYRIGEDRGSVGVPTPDSASTFGLLALGLGAMVALRRRVLA